jgi:hypothetical protein
MSHLPWGRVQSMEQHYICVGKESTMLKSVSFNFHSFKCLFPDNIYVELERSCFLTVIDVNFRVCFKTRLKFLYYYIK